MSFAPTAHQQAWGRGAGTGGKDGPRGDDAGFEGRVAQCPLDAGAIYPNVTSAWIELSHDHDAHPQRSQPCSTSPMRFS